MSDSGIITESDIRFMNRALNLAAKGKGMTSPNPMVGAVIVKNGRIISEGYHKKPGTPHAEAIAIAKAGSKAKNSSLYVTLEPCCHIDKRTPPCSKAIINAQIRKVFVAIKDPNPKVAGKGIDELIRHGIDVKIGIFEDKAKKLNEVYIKYITTGLPFVTLKVAMTLDGKIADSEGDSKWITGIEARRYVHKMRNEVDAIMTAIGTVKADNPELTVRLYNNRNIKNPARILIDPDLETPLGYKILNTPPDTILVTRSFNPVEISQERIQKKKILSDRGIQILEFEGYKVNLPWLMRELGNRGITSLMIESGSSLSARALNEGIVDKVVFFIAPKILGGKGSIPAIGGDNLRPLNEAIEIKDMKIKKIGRDIMLEGYVDDRKD